VICGDRQNTTVQGLIAECHTRQQIHGANRTEKRGKQWGNSRNNQEQGINVEEEMDGDRRRAYGAIDVVISTRCQTTSAASGFGGIKALLAELCNNTAAIELYLQHGDYWRYRLEGRYDGYITPCQELEANAQEHMKDYRLHNTI
jgi:hypothetical protein